MTAWPRPSGRPSRRPCRTARTRRPRADALGPVVAAAVAVRLRSGPGQPARIWPPSATTAGGPSSRRAAHRLRRPPGRSPRRAPLLGKSPKDVRAWMKANGNEYGWDLMDQLTEVTLGLQAWSPAQLYETRRRLLRQPPQRRQPHRRGLDHPAHDGPRRHPAARLRLVHRHAAGLGQEPGDAAVPEPGRLDQDRGQRELRPRAARTAHRRPRATTPRTTCKNSAKILTGRTIDADFNYVYDPTRHWTGPITVMGFSHANTTAAGGEAAGDAYLTLPGQPSRAPPTRLAQKLCVRFVSDTPTPSAGGRSGPGLPGPTTPRSCRCCRPSSARPSSGPAAGAKVRRPLENLLATIRALGYGAGDLTKTLPILHWMSSDRRPGAAGLDARPTATPTWPPPGGRPAR